MDTTKLSLLERQVYGRNLINQLTIDAINKIMPQLDGYIMKKIRIAQGGKAKSFKIDLLEVPYIAESGQSYRSHLKFEYMRIVLVNDVTVKNDDYEGGGYGVSYYTNKVDLGIVGQEGILKELFTKDTLIAPYALKYDAKKQQGYKEEIKKLEDKIRELRYKLVY